MKKFISILLLCFVAVGLLFAKSISSYRIPKELQGYYIVSKPYTKIFLTDNMAYIYYTDTKYFDPVGYSEHVEAQTIQTEQLKQIIFFYDDEKHFGEYYGFTMLNNSKNITFTMFDGKNLIQYEARKVTNENALKGISKDFEGYIEKNKINL